MGALRNMKFDKYFDKENFKELIQIALPMVISQGTYGDDIH